MGNGNAKQNLECEQEVGGETKKTKKLKTNNETPEDSLAAGQDLEARHDRPKKKKKKAQYTEEEQTAADEYRKQHLIGSEGDVPLPPPFTNFDALPFDSKVVAEMKKAGFQAPSPIQAQAWPVILGGSDLIAIAKTGSGKTLGFLLPVFHRIGESEQAGEAVAAGAPLCLVLAPTRELTMQIHAECERFGARAGVRASCIYGGVPLPPQRAELRKVNSPPPHY